MLPGFVAWKILEVFHLPSHAPQPCSCAMLPSLPHVAHGGILCILLWSLCVYKEFRRISLALAGAVQIPRGRYTQFREGQFFVTLGPSVLGEDKEPSLSVGRY